jgi:O-antigen/teichoic acid export membrane protein
MAVPIASAADPARRRRLLRVAAVFAGLLSVPMLAVCYFMASLATYGLYSWTEPQLDPVIVLPLVGIALAAPLAPMVLTLGEHRRFWLRIAAATSAGAVVIASLATWVPVALGWR